MLNEELAALEELAQIGFVAYNAEAGGKTWDGKDIPPYSEVGDRVQGNWRAAAKAIEAAVLKKHGLA